jgi:DUF1365 family protein
MNKALIGWGQVRHTRLRPARHAFAYPSAFLMLPMRSLSLHALARGQDGTPALAINRPGWLSFHDSDHGDGRSAAQGGALAWMQALLAAEGITDADGEIWLQTFPRVLGHTFKPVSFWYAHRQDGSLAAIVAEVNNTFGERHCYLLPAPLYGQVLESRKVFHVSPFCAVEGRYRFRFMHSRRDGVERLVARVDHDDNQGALLETSWSGTLEPATAAALRRVAWRFPLLTLGVVARIHWQALLLWLKKVPFWHKPAPPHDFVTR